MSNLETALDETMYDMIFSDIPETNYKISNSFDRKMKKMIHRYLETGTFEFQKSKPKKLWRYLIIAAVIAILSLTAAAVFYYNNISLEKYDTYSLLHIRKTENTPTAILQEYKITADLDGYTKSYYYNDDGYIIQKYDNGESSIVLSQMTFNNFEGIRINTENAERTITSVDINGITALYFEKDNVNMLIWNNDEYAFYIQANKLNKSEIISLCKSIKSE